MGKIAVPEARIKAIRDYKHPKTKRGLKVFLGTTGYYRRFVPDYARRARPLYSTLKKVAPNMIVWDTQMIEAFNYLTMS